MLSLLVKVKSQMQKYQFCSAFFISLALVGCQLLAQPVWSSGQDHQHMMDLLGITRLRDGPSGQAGLPNSANYDESLANPYPDWPELLVLDNGQPVEDAQTWWQARRPELVSAFESEVIGQVPLQVPLVNWLEQQREVGEIAGIPVIATQLSGLVDNSAYPLIEVNISLLLVLPDRPGSNVPVMILFGSRNLGQVFGREELPRFGPPPDPDVPVDPPAIEQLLAAGWGVAYLDPRSVQADNGQGLTSGIIGLVNRGQPRKPEDWGALRAWAWGASKALDYFEQHDGIDASRVGIEGVSRYGKAALVTLAFDQRFAVGLIASAGEGGVSPYRRNFGESVENLAGSGEYHWMAGNFLKYAAADSSFGSMDANDLPVDSHALIALAAPRATFISYGIPEQGDALWLDQQGSYMATVAASEVFELLGVSGPVTGQFYQDALMPPVNHGLLDGRLAWRQHDGGHTAAPNWKYFIPWANRELGIE